MPLVKPLISIAAAGVVATGLAANLFPGAGTGEPAYDNPLAEVRQAVVGAVRTGLGLLSSAAAAVLPYGLPEVLPNGDIIIRHTSPPDPPAKTAPATGLHEV